jgi:hypothetical protein
MSLDQLRQRFRERRISGALRAPAKITIVRGDWPTRGRRFAGKVRIDDRMLGYLVGGEPRAFEVEPGDHKVTVQLARRDLVVSAPGSAVVTTAVSVGPDERVVLKCGVRSDVARHWALLNTFGVRRGVAFSLFLYLFAATGWLSSPGVQGWAADTFIRYFPQQNGWIPWIQAVVGPLPLGFCMALLGGCLLGRLARGASPRAARELESRLGSPYFLEREPRMPPAAEQHA